MRKIIVSVLVIVGALCILGHVIDICEGIYEGIHEGILEAKSDRNTRTK